MTEKQLDIYFFNHLVGYLSVDDKNRWKFKYDLNYLNSANPSPISLSLPLQEGEFSDEKAYAFFSNLLPESNLRLAIARQLGISEKNDFAMLAKIGGECAGAISLYPSGIPFLDKGKYKFLSAEKVKRLFENIQTRPFLAGQKDIRMSLAGAQNKLPVYKIGKKIYLPMGDSLSSHILKPVIPNYPATIANEAFCMILAKIIGLIVADSEIYSGNVNLYCTKRFDRTVVDEKIIRIHQEDFCQILSVRPESKYESEGGPNFNSCFKLIKAYSVKPALDQLYILQWIIFNYLIGNNDAHGKNIAILFTKEGPQLAPFYDLLCTAIYEDLTPKMAMKIGGENRPHWIKKRHWERLAKENNFNFKIIMKLMYSIIEKILPAAEVVKKEIISILPEDEKYLEKIIGIIKERAQHLERVLN